MSGFEKYYECQQFTTHIAAQCPQRTVKSGGKGKFNKSNRFSPYKRNNIKLLTILKIQIKITIVNDNRITMTLLTKINDSSLSIEEKKVGEEGLIKANKSLTITNLKIITIKVVLKI